MNDKLKAKLDMMPNTPGCYIYKDIDNNVLYVGKAKRLKTRVNQYFDRVYFNKTANLVKQIEDVEFILTHSEKEALVLEINLIKQYMPPFNVIFMDDKHYPYIAISKEKYPRLSIRRDAKSKKFKHYGPFPDSKNAYQVLHLLNSIYPFRKCKHIPSTSCLYYHMKQCLAPCVNNLEDNCYNQYVKDIDRFFKGNSNELIKDLSTQMYEASDNLNFEKALELKNMLDDINTTLKKQTIDLNKDYNFDLVNYYYDNNYISIEIFFIRQGLLFGRHNEIISSLGDYENEVVEYLIKFYDNAVLPKELLIPETLDEELLKEYFNIKVNTPQKGKLKNLVDLAKENAKEQLDLQKETLKKDDDERINALNELKNLLGLEKLTRMESFDNSHLFGTFYVGGMVVFDDFLPNKDLYRKYKISTDVKDDISAMKEVIYRRYFKTLMEESYKPDLIVMDGGIQQINACKEVLESLNLEIPFIG